MMRAYICAGAADSPTSQLNAFDAALKKAGIEDLNLSRLSSILPPQHEVTSEIPLFSPGSLMPTAYATMMSSEPGVGITAVVGVAVPTDPTQAGLIMERHGHEPLEVAYRRMEAMLKEGMSTRSREIKALHIEGVTHTVQAHGAVFAGILIPNLFPIL